MKAVYMYDTVTRIFKGSKVVDDDNYVLQTGETLIEPAEGLYDPKKFSADGTEWIGTDKEVWEAEQDAAYQAYLKEHPELAPQPSAMDTALANLSAMVLQNQQQTQAQLAAIASTVLKTQVANTTNGGNI